jgi:hypothetical protein
MAQNRYSYDPAASIEKSFQGIQQNVASAFSSIIAQKQQDFALADKVFQNLDAITEQTAAIGSARINEGIKNLTKIAGQKIYKDGKFNFEGMGEVMKGVSQIKQLKNYWSGASELKKQYLNQAAASNKDMVSLSSFISKIDPLIAENEGGSTTDLQKKLASLYDNHLDYNKIAREQLTSVIPVDKVMGETVNPKGGRDAYSFEALRGMMYDPKTQKVVMPAPEVVIDPQTQKPVIDPATQKPKTISFLDKAKAALTQNNPNFLSEWKRHHGLSDSLVTDDAVTQQILDSFTVTPSFKQLETKEDIQKKKDEAFTSGVEAKNVETLTALRIKQINASIAASIAQANKANASALGKTSATNAPKGFVIPKIGNTKDGVKYMNLTQPVTITATGANKGFTVQGGKPTDFEINKISINKDNKIIATGSIVSGGFSGTRNKVQNIMLSASDYNAFINKLGGMPAIHRYSNSLVLQELGLKNDIPPSYLNIEQDTDPDPEWTTVKK